MARSGWERLADLFEEAAALPAERRKAFLDERCGRDADLRARVEQLLENDARAGAFLRTASESAVAPAPAEDLEGRRLGSYRLQRVVASGGMGTVYEALQDNPPRRVALKVMRLGFETAAARRRFEYEAAVLGRLQDPGIAEIYEAGVHAEESGGGRRSEVPFFAMEFVEGARPLPRFADEEGLGVRARLLLFLRVCDAVHHGHQRGVIHRDLKPANLLVDATGAPKVIDFGIARAAEADEADPLATRAGELVGTLRYMSPEQVAADGSALDVRSDVYTLGVVLYELLVGASPHRVAEGESTWVELATAIRERPVPRPRELVPSLPSELEWILLRALEKERERRYGAVSDLAADLRRFLAHEPVAAGAPGRVYRFRKFVRRNRSGVTFAAAALVALVAGALAALVGMLRAREAEARALVEQAKLETTNAFLEGLLDSPHPARDGREVRVVDVLGDARGDLEALRAEQPDVFVSLSRTLGRAYGGLGLHGEATELLEGALAVAEDRLSGADETLWTRRDLARVLLRSGEHERAEELLAPTVAELRRRVGDLPDVAVARADLASVYQRRGRFDEAEALYREILAELDGAEDHPAWIHAAAGLGDLCLVRGRYGEARALLEGAVEAGARLEGPESYGTLTRQAVLGAVLVQAEQLVEAVALLEPLLEPLRRLSGESLQALTATSDLSSAYLRLGRVGEGLALARECVELAARIHGPDSPERLPFEVRLASALSVAGRAEEARARFEALLEECRGALGAEDRLTLHCASTLVILHLQALRWEEAEPLAREVLAAKTRALGEDHPSTLSALQSVALSVWGLGRGEEAEELLERVLERAERVLPVGHSLREGLYGHLADLYGQLGRFDEGEAVLLDGFDALEEELGARHPGVLRRAGNLARYYRSTGRPELAPPWEERSRPD